MTSLPVTTSIRWLRKAQRIAQSATRWIEAFVSGICMGLIDDVRFADFDTYPFDETQAMDSLPEATAGLNAWEQATSDTHLRSPRSVLVVAAGGGRALLGLSELGHDVQGLEYGAALCGVTNDRLRELQCRATVVSAQRWKIPTDRKFDAAWMARHYLSHIRGRTNRVDLLRGLRGVLSKDARLIVSYYIRDRRARAFGAQAVLANFLRACRRSTDPRIDIGDHVDPESPLLHHHYTPEEIGDELREAGFEVIEQDASWFGWAVARPTQHEEIA